MRFPSVVVISCLALVCSTLAGCDSFGPNLSNGPTAQVELSLGVALPGQVGKLGAADELVVSGENGVLTISEVWFILDEFELERGQHECDDNDEAESEDTNTDDSSEPLLTGCEDIEVGPLFVEVPLDAESIPLFAADVPLGTYSELEFEIENLDSDDVDDRLATEIRNRYPDWPSRASVVVEGSFMPTGSTAERSFRVYVDAEIEVELTIDPPLELTADAVAKALTIIVDPLGWLGLAGQTVPDLSAFDYTTTGTILDFDLEIEHGFEIRSNDHSGN